MSGFTFNGIHSKAKHIKSIKTNRTLVAERKHTIVTIPHSDNVILIPDDTKQHFSIPIQCLIEIPSDKSIFDIGRDLTVWLTTDNWAQLIFDDDPNYYYEAISITSISVEDLRLNKSNTLPFEFLCKPVMKVVWS